MYHHLPRDQLETTKLMKELSQIPTDRARHNRAKVTEQDVREMRALRKAGMTYKAIGEKYGLGINAAFKASNGYSWQHVQ